KLTKRYNSILINKILRFKSWSVGTWALETGETPINKTNRTSESPLRVGKFICIAFNMHVCMDM
ncbi:hypothetical protein ACQP3F_32045, partial [Escherichia coli]